MDPRLSNPTFNSVLFCIVAVWTTTEKVVRTQTTAYSRCWISRPESVHLLAQAHDTAHLGTYPAAAIEVYTSSEMFVENGTTGTLKCWFKSTEVISSQASLSWSFIPEGSPDSTGVPIFYYSGGKAFPDNPQFKPRVEWAGDLNKKDASIRVTRMQFWDNGTYSCDVKNPPDISGKPSLTKLRVVMKEFPQETSPRKTEEYCLRTVA